jgi:hypothetical protein
MVTVKVVNGKAVEENVMLERSVEIEVVTEGVNGFKVMAGGVRLMDESLAA